MREKFRSPREKASMIWVRSKDKFIAHKARLIDREVDKLLEIEKNIAR